MLNNFPHTYIRTLTRTVGVLDGVDVGLADVVCLVVFGVVEKVVDGQAAEDVLGAEEFSL